MQIAVLTFDGFNEIDSFVAAHILNRLRPQGWRAFITSPDAVITSANEVVVHAERPLEFAAEADAVIIGSGLKTSEIAENRKLLGRIRLDPTRQLIGSQCSGALLLASISPLGSCCVPARANTLKPRFSSSCQWDNRPITSRGQSGSSNPTCRPQPLRRRPKQDNDGSNRHAQGVRDRS